MANFGDISANLSIGGNQSIRRNAANTMFEVYDTGSGGDLANYVKSSSMGWGLYQNGVDWDVSAFQILIPQSGASIGNLYSRINYVDSCLGWTSILTTKTNASLGLINIATLNASIGAINASLNLVTYFSYKQDASLGQLEAFNDAQEASISNLYARVNYVDSCLGWSSILSNKSNASLGLINIATLNASIGAINTSLNLVTYFSYKQDVSIGVLEAFNDAHEGSIANLYARVNYVDSCLGWSSILSSKSNASLGLINIATLNASIGAINASLNLVTHFSYKQDVSIGIATALNTAEEASIANLYARVNYVDSCLGLVTNLTYKEDSSIGWLTTRSFTADASITVINASIVAEKQKWIDINRTGFVSSGDVSITFNPTTYVLQLIRTGGTWKYFRAGIEYTFSTDPSVQIANPPSKGIYFVSIDNNNGTLSSSTVPWTLMDDTLPVAFVLWDSSTSPTYQVASELHQSLIDRRMHYYLHSTRGTQYINGGIVSGPTIGGTTNLTNVFSVTQTVLADEDLILTLPTLATPDGSSLAYTCLYRTNASTWVWKDSSVPYLYGATNSIQYDSSGTLTEVTSNNDYVNWYLLYSNLYGTARYALFPGRSKFVSLSGAQAEDVRTFDFTGFPIKESVIAYQMTWLYKNAQSNQGKVQLATDPVKINVTTVTSVGSAAGSDHNSLSGLQGGVSGEYYHLSNSQYNWIGLTDVSIGNLYAFNTAEEASIKNLYDRVNYVDSCLGWTSILTTKTNASLGLVNIATLNASIGLLNSSMNLVTYLTYKQDVSLGQLEAFNDAQEASISNLYARVNYLDPCLGWASILASKSNASLGLFNPATINASIGAINVSLNLVTYFSYKQDVSIGVATALNTAEEASIANLYARVNYVDSCLGWASILASKSNASLGLFNPTTINASIGNINTSLNNLGLENSYQDVSLNDIWVKFGYVDTCINNLSSNAGTSQAYVDGSLARRDASLDNLYQFNTAQEVSISNLYARVNYVDSCLGWASILASKSNASLGLINIATLNASIGAINTSLNLVTYFSYKQDVSIGVATALNTAEEASIANLYARVNYVDSCLGWASILASKSNASLGLINIATLNASIGAINVSLNLLTHFAYKQEVSIGIATALNNAQEGSINFISGNFIRSASIGGGSAGLKWDGAYIDISITSNLKFTNGALDTSISSSGTLAGLGDVSIVNASSNDVIKYNASFGKWMNRPDFWDVSANNTSVFLVDPSDNVELSYIEMQDNGGVLMLADMPISSAAISSEQSYSMKIDGSSALRVYGVSASTALSEIAVVVDANYFALGDPATDGSWRLKIDTSGNLSVQKRVTGSWIEKGNFN